MQTSTSQDSPVVSEVKDRAASTIALSEYVARGLLTEGRASTIRSAIAERKNIVVAGKMSSGKTTLLDSLLDVAAELRPLHRLVIVQKRNELRAEKFENKLALLACVPQARVEIDGTVSRYTYDFTDALEDALQSNPNFLACDELCDGKSTGGLTTLLNVGVCGLMTTIRVDSAEETLRRIEDILRLEGKVIVNRMLARLVNVIVFIQHDEETDKRRVSEVVEVQGIDGKGNYVLAKY